MNISEKKLEKSAVELHIVVPQEKVEIEYKAVFDKLQRSVKVDGFRKGKAPLQLVETRYQRDADKEVAENLLKSMFWEAVQEKQLTPIMLPKFQYDTIAREKPFSFRATFDVPPSIELGKYKHIQADEAQCAITDENVDTEIDATRERFATVTGKEAGALVQKDDLVKIKVKRIDNVDEGEQEKMGFREFSIVVGKSKDESALDKYIEGMKVDEEKAVDVKYPNDYQIKDLAGQKVKYLVRVSEISTVELPPLDDEFAKRVGYESVNDLRAKTREFLEKYVSERTRGDAKAQIIREVVEGSTFDLPESMIITEMGEIFRKTCERFGLKSDSLEELAAALSMDEEALRERLYKDAEQAVKTTLTLSEIGKKEELKVDEARYREIVENIAKRNNRTVEEIETILTQNNSRENIESELLLDQTMDFLYENAKVKKLKPVSFEEFLKQQNRKEG